MNCAFDSVDGNLFKLVLPEEHQALQSEMAVKKIEEELRKHLGCTALVLEIKHGEPQVDTPAQRKLRQENQRLAEAKADMVNDPFVKELQQQLGARVIDETIKPV